MNKSIVDLLTPDNIKKVSIKKNYKLFNSPEVNVWGVRAEDLTPDIFNDIILTFMFDGCDVQKIEVFEATTDPGKNGMLSPENKDGIAILNEGQYLDTWTVGIHKTYDALVQAKDITVTRDDNKDLVLDVKSKKKSKAYGINIHRASAYNVLDKVGPYSQGCQVINSALQYSKFLSNVRNALRIAKKKYVSYTLINQKDLRDVASNG